MSQSEDLMDDHEIHWTPLLEKFFKTTAERAHALSWCHKEAEQLYSTRTSIIDIPVIVLSIFNGAISVGSASLFGDSSSSSVGVGMVALFTAIMNSVNSYYGWARRVEAHKNAALNYAELYTFLCVELGLPREERIAAKKLVKMIRDDMNKLRKTSPLIPPPIKKLFHSKFKDVTNIAIPEEMNGLEEVVVYRTDKDSERTAVAVRTVRPAFMEPVTSPLLTRAVTAIKSALPSVSRSTVVPPVAPSVVPPAAAVAPSVVPSVKPSVATSVAHSAQPSPARSMFLPAIQRSPQAPPAPQPPPVVEIAGVKVADEEEQKTEEIELPMTAVEQQNEETGSVHLSGQ